MTAGDGTAPNFGINFGGKTPVNNDGQPTGVYDLITNSTNTEKLSDALAGLEAKASIIDNPAVHELLFNLEVAHEAGEELSRGGFDKAYQVNNDAAPTVLKNPSTQADKVFTAAARTLSATGYSKDFVTIDLRFGADVANLMTGRHVLLQYQPADATDAIDFLVLDEGDIKLADPADPTRLEDLTTRDESEFNIAGDKHITMEVTPDPSNRTAGIQVVTWAVEADGTAVDFNDNTFPTGRATWSVDSLVIPDITVGANTYTPIERLVLASHGGTYYRHSFFNTSMLARIDDQFAGLRYTGAGSDTLRYTGTNPAFGFEGTQVVTLIENGQNNPQSAPEDIAIPAALADEFVFLFLEGVNGGTNQLIDTKKAISALQTGNYDVNGTPARFAGNTSIRCNVAANGDLTIQWMGASSTYYWTNVFVAFRRTTKETHAEWTARNS